jgi:hypothetical protein
MPQPTSSLFFFCFVFVFSSCRFLFIHVLKNRRAHEQQGRNLNAALRCEAPVKQACPIRDLKKQAFYVITILVVLLTCGAANDTWGGCTTSPMQNKPTAGKCVQRRWCADHANCTGERRNRNDTILSEVSFPGGDLDGARGTSRSAFRGGRTTARHEYDTRGLPFVKTQVAH